MYTIKYLPLALDDLSSIMHYIANTLNAPRAAENLRIKINKEVLKLSDNPFCCRVYFSSEKLKYEYRALRIDNYLLFYTVEKQLIEIHRAIFARRDTRQILEGQEATEFRMP